MKYILNISIYLSFLKVIKTLHPMISMWSVFYTYTKETYFKFKKNILPKKKKMQPNFQEPIVEYCEPDQVIDICSYNHYPVLDKTNETQEQHNDDNDIYNTSELEHEFEYGIYEDVFKTEQLMAELKRIDEAEQENKKLRDLEFKDFPLEQFSDAGKVANEGDPHLKVAADTELYDLEKCAIQIDIDKHKYENSSYNTDDNSSPCADDNASQSADGNSSQSADDYIQPTKVEQLMAELKRIDEAEQENKKLRDLEFKDFPLEQFSDAGKVANEGDPHLKVAADTELYDLEKCAIQIDIDKHKYENSSYNTDDNSSPCADDNASQSADGNSSQSADDYIQPTKVSHVQSPTVGEKYHVEHDNTLQKMVYGPTYVPYNKDGQKLLWPQTTDMSRKDNLKLLYNSLPKGMCDNEYESLEQAINDVETFQYSHKTSTKHVVAQGV